MLQIELMVFNQIQENTYIVYCSETKECAIIDAGCRSRMEKIKFRKKIEELGLTPKHLLNTHLHFDHIYGNKFVYDTWGLLTEASEKDQFFIDTYLDQLNLFGFPTEEQAPGIGRKLKNGDIIEIGNESLTVLETPGHSAGGLCFYSAKDKVCFVGDTIFRESVGRTDFPSGSQDEIIRSIENQLMKLPGDTRLLSGHGEETSVEYELMHNPYLKF